MATIVAVRSGNWSDTSHVTGPWPGGSTPTTKPGIGDTVQTGDCLIEIDEDVHVALLESTSTGYFQVTDVPELPAVRTITANVQNSGEANGGLGVSNLSGLVETVGDVTGGSVAGSVGIYNIGAIGNIIIDGSLICGANGLFPIFGPFKLVANPANAITVISSTDAPLTLSNDYPAEADVKDGVDYNRGTMTGELAAGGSIGPVSIVIGGGGIRIS